ncbi:MAG: hypothetical protein GXX85_08315 [Ignavibacteria bacterium]|nr:hypothetical protein [Ignavibacteria bacterium]
MKNIIISLLLVLIIPGCYTLNHHPELQAKNSKGEMDLIFVTKETKCLNCHNAEQLVDYGYLVAVNDDEFEKIKLKFPYWAGDVDEIVIPDDEYIQYNPQLYELPEDETADIEIIEYEPSIVIFQPVIVGPAISDPAKKERKTVIPEYLKDIRNSGGRGSENSGNTEGNNDSNERGNRRRK